MTTNKLTNDSGFSMVQILVAMVALSAISVGVMKVMESAGKSAKAITVTEEINQVHREMVNTLSDPNNCRESLGELGVDPNFASNPGGSGNVAGISMFDPSNPASSKSKFIVEQAIPNRLSLTGLSIKELLPDEDGDWSRATATLVATYTRPTSSGGGQHIRKDIKITADLCSKNVMTTLKTSNDAVDTKSLTDQCLPPRKILQGVTTWAGKRYLICQDCTGVSAASLIKYCQAVGGDSEGENVQGKGEISCAYMGGSFDMKSSQCLFAGKTMVQRVCDLEAKSLELAGKSGTTSCGVAIAGSTSTLPIGGGGLPVPGTPAAVKIALVGGGGGGGNSGSGNGKGGAGGKAGQVVRVTLPDAYAGATCTSTLGAAGKGGSNSGGARDGERGGTTTVRCSKAGLVDFVVSASGGSGGRGKDHVANKGYAGQDSPFGKGGAQVGKRSNGNDGVNGSGGGGAGPGGGGGYPGGDGGRGYVQFN